VPRIVLEFAIKTRYALILEKHLFVLEYFPAFLKILEYRFKLFIFELLITLNIQESRINNANEQKNV